MPLKTIPRCLSPDLLHTLAAMGHGDEIGVDIPTLLDGVLQLLPLDQYVEMPVALMDPVPSDKAAGIEIPVWKQYRQLVDKHEGEKTKIEYVERFAFYDRAKKAFAVVHTGELAKYGNIILKKGVAM
ncbi:hypothetical protein FSP39_006947 [Pinctada imbricata]|uniref:L-fucose mutarotase n=1 Tax=Pinctada imbricata TaxID=66713 RepID=A0AA88XZJ7_PINIB|nr:hypothetical protein FSP39_006947 [Pinctada imbricata]